MIEADSALRILFDTIDDLAVMVGESGIILQASRTLADRLGYSSQELLNMHILALFPPEYRHHVIERHLEGQIAEYIPLVSKDGKYVSVKTYASVCVHNGEKITLSLFRDLDNVKAPTKSKSTVNHPESANEFELENQINFFHSLFDAIPDLLFIKGLDSRYLLCNKAYSTSFAGMDKNEIIGKTPLDIVKDKEMANRFMETDKEIIISGAAQILEETLTMADGSKMDVEISRTPVLNSDGRVTGLVGISRDITNRKKMENIIKSEQEYARMLINLVPSAIFSVDKNRIVTSWNKMAEKLTGYTAPEIIGKPCRVFSHEPCKDYCSLYSDNVEKPFINKVCTIRNKNGEIRTLSKNSDLIRNEKGEVIGGIECFEDITEKKLADEALDQKDKILTAVAFSIKELIHNKDLYQAAENCFSLLGQAAGVDRVYLFENSIVSGKKVATSMASWYSDKNRFGIGVNNHPSIPFDVMPVLTGILGKGEARYGFVDDIRDNAVKQFMLANGVISFLIMPIFVRDTFWGFVGFDSCRTRKVWTNSDFSILGAFVSSLEKTIDRNLAEHELEISRQEAETASLMKGQFIANVSHEIRTPMNGIIGFVELLSRTELNREQSEFLREIRSASDSLLLLINDILDYSKIEADKVVLEDYPFNCVALIEDSVSLFAPKACEKGLEIYSYVDPLIPRNLSGDQVRLQQVLNNLIGNAVKFTEKGEISVLLDLIEDIGDRVTLELAVRDTGIGISNEEQKKLFRVFSQADASTTRKYGGTGLGLAISYKLVHLMGGELSVTSVPREGSTFSARITLKKDSSENIVTPVQNCSLNILILDRSATHRTILRKYLEHCGCTVAESDSWDKFMDSIEGQQVFDLILIDHEMLTRLDVPSESQILSAGRTNLPFIILVTPDAHKISSAVQESRILHGVIKKPVKEDDLMRVIGIRSNAGNEASANLPIMQESAPESGRPHFKILLVEDMPANRKLASVILNKLGYSTDCAENGLQAVELCKENKYDMIFMDCQMPLLDGYQASEKIRNEPGMNKESVIVAMTANAMKGDREKCMASGMDDYISKPITINNVGNVLKKWLTEI